MSTTISWTIASSPGTTRRSRPCSATTDFHITKATCHANRSRSIGVPANLAEELLHVTDLSAEKRIVLKYLRVEAALADWQRSGLERDCSTVLGITPAGLLDHVRTCGSAGLLPAAIVIANAAERAAAASPKSMRRIARARCIGLGGAR